MSSHVDPDHSMGFALKRLQQALRSQMDAALADYGLTSPQYAVLAMLAGHPGMSNAELARRSFVSAPTMLRILDALVRDGLITRAARTPEQRVRGNALTGTGRQQLEGASVHVQEFEELLRAEAAPDHIETIMAWMRACAERLNG